METTNHGNNRPIVAPPKQAILFFFFQQPVEQRILRHPKNQLIRRLKTNGKLGLIINASELDMISGAMKQKCGHHDDVFRAAFHHEPVSTDYKVDDQIICAEDPHLALSFTGTPNQLAFFIPSLANGLYSRFIILTAESRWKYRSAAPIRGKEDVSVSAMSLLLPFIR
ncbi:DUF3987 domain-containing protein [Bacteroides caecimuris]|uniref:DUF3987 domain-containing protein n=1 Tax=Bacteroides caecimuris TaxID=1796613 RepID=A0A4S2CCS4_9BACE|nr:DUF3987 domain-containing protein [Bacteroides caecimuris]